MNVYSSGGSGWVVDTLLAVEVKVAAPVRQSGSSFIPMPATLSGLSRSILNVRNKSDDFCFLYCVLAALYPQKKHCDRHSSYMHLLERLDFNIQDFPMCLSKKRFFERRNNVSITVYRFENENLYNVYHSKNSKSKENQVTVADGGHKMSLLSHQKLLECYA